MIMCKKKYLNYCQFIDFHFSLLNGMWFKKIKNKMKKANLRQTIANQSKNKSSIALYQKIFKSEKWNFKNAFFADSK